MKKVLLTLAVVALIVNPAYAADFYWDGDADASDNNSTTGQGLGDSGTWDNTTLNWWDPIASPGADIAWTDGNNAIFWGDVSPATLVIPVATTRSATGLTFKTNDFNLSATGTTSTGVTARGIITLTGTVANPAPIIVDSGVLAGITAKLSGTTGFALSGGGTLKLAEANGGVGGLNNITGNFSVTNSVLEVIGGGQLGGSTGSMTLNNATYRNIDTTVAGNLTTTTPRPIVIGTGGGTLETTSAAQILLYAGNISGAGNTTLTKIGPGEIRMNSTSTGGANVFGFQKLRVLEGRYTIGQATTLGADTQLGAVPGSYLADAVTLDGQGTGAILRFNGGTATTTITTDPRRGFTLGTTSGGTNTLQVNETNAAIPGVITGTGGFIKTGGLMLTLSGANTYQGGTTITAGTVRLADLTPTNVLGDRLGPGATIVNSTGTLQINTTGTSGSQGAGGVTINADGTLSGTGTLSGALTLASGARILPGLAAANAALTVPNADLSAGTILQSTIGSPTPTPASDVLTVTTASTGLNLNGGTVTVQPLTGTNPAGTSYKIIGYTTGYSGSVNTMLLNNITGYEGTQIVDVPGESAIKVNVGTVLLDRVWIRENGIGNWNIDQLPGPNETANWARTDNTTPAVAPNGIGSKMTIPATSPITSQPINSQGITLSDYTKTLGTLVITNPNSIDLTSAQSAIRLRFETYTGPATIDVQAGSHSINTGATLTAGGTVQLISPTNIIVAPGATLTMGPTANIGGMTKTGTGMLRIIGSDWNQTGATNINAGTLKYSSDNLSGLGNSSHVTIANGATMDMSSNETGVKVNDSIGALSGGGSLINHGNLTIAGTASGTFTGTMGISASLGGNGNPFAGLNPGRIFTKNGAGVQIIGGTLESTSGAIGGNFDATTTNTAANTVLSTVAAGTLLLNNPSGTSLTTSTAPLAVSSGATLGGTGYINGPITINVGGNLSPGSLGIGTFHTGVGLVTFGSAATGTARSTLNIELNTTVGLGDISDRLDASASTITFGINAVKPQINLVNAGTMTGGEYTIVNYSALTNGITLANLPILNAPTGFTAKYDTGTANVLKVLVHFNGDFNNDNVVDAGDYVTWRKHEGLTGALFTQGDGNGDGTVNSADYTVWRANFGKSITPAAGSGSGLGGAAVPEPTALALLLLGCFFGGAIRRRG